MNDAVNANTDGATSPPGDAAPAQPAIPDAGPIAAAEAAPSAPLTAYQKRKQREAEREREKADRAAKRAAKGAAKPKAASAPAAADAPAEAPADPDRDDKARRREAAMFWRFVGRLASLCAWPFGYRFEPITAAEGLEDAEYLLPLAQRYRWFDVAIRWAAIPFVLGERLAAKVKRREPPKQTAPARTEPAAP